jgi:hypothetical protein
MKTIHIIPGSSAAGSLTVALQGAGRTDEVFVFRDDLSCGPIAPDASVARERWWTEEVGWPAEDGEDLGRFWEEACKLRGRIVVWFSAHSAREMAFRLAWAWHMKNARYNLIDITERQISCRKPDGTDALVGPFVALGAVQADVLSALLDSERSATAEEEAAACDRWEHLMAENAPFRVVTPHGLASAPIDYFDSLLLAQADHAWKTLYRVIGDTMGHNYGPYDQVGDWMLYTRLIALIDAGRLIADGDVGEGHSCRVRLPGE